MSCVATLFWLLFVKYSKYIYFMENYAIINAVKISVQFVKFVKEKKKRRILSITHHFKKWELEKALID